MPLKSIPTIYLKSEPTRQALWQKRLRMETKCMRRCRTNIAMRPYPEGRRVMVARIILKLLGLFERGVHNANSPVLRRLTFAFDALPPAFDGFRILHVSDFHFYDPASIIPAMRNLLDGIEADLAVLTGDFRFNRLAPCHVVYTGIRELLAAVKLRHGAVAILGNNDMSDFVEGFGALGIRMLVNENIELTQDDARIWIAGVDDSHEFHCASLSHALDGIPEAAFTILLAHSPEIIPKAAERGVDLYLCGHTHGGQIRIPGIGPLHLNVRSSRQYGAGSWRHANLQGYTTTGIGASTLPIRFNCPPEAVLIELKRSAANT